MSLLETFQTTIPTAIWNYSIQKIIFKAIIKDLQLACLKRLKYELFQNCVWKLLKADFIDIAKAWDEPRRYDFLVGTGLYPTTSRKWVMSLWFVLVDVLKLMSDRAPSFSNSL